MKSAMKDANIFFFFLDIYSKLIDFRNSVIPHHMCLNSQD